MKLLLKFFLFLLFFSASVILAIYFFVNQNSKDLVDSQLLRYSGEVEKRFIDETNTDIVFLSDALDIISDNSEIREIFSKRDRQALYDRVLPIFEKIKKDSEITHFYFILPDGECFLRVHDPGNHGDIIRRASFREAAETNETGSGVELGKNVFAIRVVKPYYHNGEKIGYIEFSKEIESLLATFSQETEGSFSIYGEKQYLNQADWTAIRQKRGLPDNWTDLSHSVFLAKSEGANQSALACVDSFGLENFIKDSKFRQQIDWQGKRHGCFGVKIFDKTSGHIATIIVGHDIGGIINFGKQTFNSLFWSISSLVAVFMLLLFLLLRIWIVKPVKIINQGMHAVGLGQYSQLDKISKDELGDLMAGFNLMSDKLRKTDRQLKLKSGELKKRIEELSLVNESLDRNQEELAASLHKIEMQKKDLSNLVVDLEKFKLALDNTSDCVIIAGFKNGAIYANKAAENNLYLEDGLKRLWQEETSADFHEKLKQAIEERKSDFAAEVMFRSRSGKDLVMEFDAFPVKDVSGEVIFFVIMGRDVTKMKEVEKIKSDFVALTSHQLRTPLTSIKWLVELLLKEKTGRLNKRQKEFLKSTYDSTNRLVLLVRDLLNVSQLETGRLNINLKSIDINQVIQGVLGEINVQIKDKALSVKLNLDKKISQIMLDELLIRQAVSNIISNAVKYTPPKGHLTIATRQDKNSVIIEIADSGVGIPPREQAQIFKRFFRASNVQSNFTEGTGLGLYIAQSVVNIFGGKVDFSSVVDKGSTFRITLPIEKTNQP